MQYPENPEPLHNDDIAFDNLKTVFSKERFVIEDQRTVVGKREFGVDFVIELQIQRGRKSFNTGAQFFVQSKVTTVDPKRDHVSVSLKVSTVFYLLRKSPV